jgi:hypothetical protein
MTDNNTAAPVAPETETREKRGPAAGVYRLARDVKNPKPDRRAKLQWNAQEVIPKGLRLLSDGYGRLEKVRGGTFEAVTNAVYITDETGLYGLLVANMVPDEETVGKILTLARVDCIDAAEVLAMLVEAGKLSVEDVKGAVEMVSIVQGPEGIAPDFKAFEKKHGLV